MADTEGKKLTELRVIDLKTELERRGLDKTGNKAALLERLSKVIVVLFVSLIIFLQYFTILSPSLIFPFRNTHTQLYMGVAWFLGRHFNPIDPFADTSCRFGTTISKSINTYVYIVATKPIIHVFSS